MSILEWKQFNFFDVKSSSEFDKLKNIKSEITSTAQNNSSEKVFCDASGFVHVFFRNWDYMSFQAHSQPIKLCAVANESKFLITLAQDIMKTSLQLQAFNLQKLTKRNGAPCISTARITTINLATVLRICLIGDLFCIAIGLEKGDVLIYRGPVVRDISSGFRCISVSTRAINGIEFKQKDSLSYSMFVCSYADINVFTITENNSIIDTKIELDCNLAPSRCCTLQPGSGETYFIVGRDDALYCFTTEDRGPCYAIEGKKSQIAWFGNNLVVVVQPDEQTLNPNPQSQIIIIDINNKMIVLNRLCDYIRYVIVDNGNCYIINSAYDISILQERNLKSKLNLVLKKKMFEVALRLLENDGDDDFSASQINFEYGNYLLQRGDINGAVQKFKSTIGVIEPYLIIKKLMDSRYNEYLAEYLKQLVKSNCATEKHFELLLNCRERISLPSEIENLCSDNEMGLKNIGDLTETKFLENEDSKKDHEQIYDNFMKLISVQDKDQVFSFENNEDKIFSYFAESVEKLMTSHAQPTIKAIKLICGEKAPPKFISIKNPQRFIPILLPYANNCIDFLEYLITLQFDNQKTVCNILLELYLNEWKNEKKEASEIIDFIDRKISDLYSEDVITLSRSYNFWPGIIFVCKKCDLSHLCAQYVFKDYEIKEKFNNFDNHMDLYAKNWLQVFNKSEMSSEYFKKFFKHMVKTILSGTNQSLLQVLQNISGNQNAQVSHLREFFKEENLQKTTGFSRKCDTVIKLQEKLDDLNILLQNFSTKPIEFRCSFCDICRQQLKFPAIYFLCQHSFHKECLNAYSESSICVICCSSKIAKECNKMEFSVNSKELDESLLKGSPVEAVSLFLGEANFYHLLKETQLLKKTSEKEMHKNKNETNGSGSSASSHWEGRFERGNEIVKKKIIGNQTYDDTKNPFENESAIETNVTTNPLNKYDSNLNPFNE